MTDTPRPGARRLRNELQRLLAPFVDDTSRCALCGWPLKDEIRLGCVRGNCSFRPLPTRWYAPDRAKAEYGGALGEESPVVYNVNLALTRDEVAGLLAALESDPPTPRCTCDSGLGTDPHKSHCGVWMSVHADPPASAKDAEQMRLRWKTMLGLQMSAKSVDEIARDVVIQQMRAVELQFPLSNSKESGSRRYKADAAPLVPGLRPAEASRPANWNPELSDATNERLDDLDDTGGPLDFGDE